MTAQATKPLHLHRLVVKNLKRIEALTIPCNGQHVIISGPNSAGKTSAVDALWAALGGKTAKAMSEPIRHGADRAEVELELREVAEPITVNGFLVRKVWTKAGPKLLVKTTDGEEINSPQTFLAGLLDQNQLNLSRFLDMRPQDQLDEVLASRGVKPPVADVQALTGETHQPRPGESAAAYMERLSADDTGIYFVRRREIGRGLTQAKAALEESRRSLDAAGGPPEKREESATAIVARIQELHAEDEKRRDAIRAAEDSRANYDAGVAKLTELAKEREREEAAIADLRKQITAREATVKQLTTRIDNGKAAVEEWALEAEALEVKAARMPENGPELDRLRHNLSVIEEQNKALAKRRTLAQEADRLALVAGDAEASHQTVDGILEGLRRLRANLLNDIDLGISGLQVGAGELRLNGVPFDQAGAAEQLLAAGALAMSRQPPPRLPLLRIDGGERFDNASKAKLLALANERGYQVIETVVDPDGDGLEWEIVEGAVA